MVITLKAKFDGIKGTSDMAIAKRATFDKHWKEIGFYLVMHLKVKWIFSPPKWLLLVPPP